MNPTFFRPERNHAADEFQQSLPVNVNFSFDTIAPAIYDAEQKYLFPIVGSSLWDELKQYYEADEHDEPNALFESLIARLQSASLRIAYFESFDLLAVEITDAGIENPLGEKSPYRYQADAARETLGRQAFEHLQIFYDALVDSGLRTWDPGDPSNPHRSDSLFKRPNEFFDTIDQLPDYRLFLRLRQQITIAEHTCLPFRLGSTLADELLTQHATGRMADTLVLSLARRFIAFSVLADSVMFLQAYLSADGATTRTIKAEGATGGTAVQPADLQARQAMQRNYAHAAEAAITHLVDYLQQHIDIYPEIASVVPSTTHQSRLHIQTKHSFRV